MITVSELERVVRIINECRFVEKRAERKLFCIPVRLDARNEESSTDTCVFVRAERRIFCRHVRLRHTPYSLRKSYGNRIFRTEIHHQSEHERVLLGLDVHPCLRSKVPFLFLILLRNPYLVLISNLSFSRTDCLHIVVLCLRSTLEAPQIVKLFPNNCNNTFSIAHILSLTHGSLSVSLSATPWPD